MARSPYECVRAASPARQGETWLPEQVAARSAARPEPGGLIVTRRYETGVSLPLHSHWVPSDVAVRCLRSMTRTDAPG